MSSNQFLQGATRVAVMLAVLAVPAFALGTPEIDPGSSVAPLALFAATFVMLAKKKS